MVDLFQINLNKVSLSNNNPPPII